MEKSSDFQMNLLRRQAVGDILHRTAQRLPNKTAFVFREKRWTYKVFNEMANRTAHALLELGLKKGETLAIMSQNCQQMATLMWACFKMGARFSPLNYLLRGREISYQVNHSDAKIMFVEDALFGEVQKVLQDLPMVQRFGLIKLKEGVELPKGWIDVDDLMSDKYPATTPEVIIHDDDIASLIYTSGTTAAPKGVALQHKSYYSIALNMNTEWIRFYEDDVYLMNIPLYHVGASSIMVGFYNIGATIVATHGVDPMEIMNLIPKEKVTFLIWPPTLYAALLQLPLAKFDLTSIKKMGWFGGSLPLAVFRKWPEICPQATWFSHCSQSECNLHGVTGWYKKEPKAGNIVGTPPPSLELKLVDADGNEVPVGEPGEALFRAPGVMLGYYKDEKSTAETLKDGWLHTGDIFMQDQDGMYYYVDRMKDMIKTGGTNVACLEVEEILNVHPDIEISAVFSAPHPYWGEGVVAAVLSKRESLTEAEVIEFAKDKLARYKLPKKIIMVKKRTELPVSPTGKILKRVLREKYQDVFKDVKGK